MSDARRSLGAEDIYRMKLVRDAQISPDGRLVAYVVRSADRDLDADLSSLWLADIETGASRQITDGAFEDALPRWSPDGQCIAFTSDRTCEGVSNRSKRNIWIIHTDGSGLRQLTHFEDDVSSFPMYPIGVDLAWAPDSRHICFTVKDPWPSPPHTSRTRVYETVRFKLAEEGWLDGRPRHLWTVALDSGPSQLTFGDEDEFEPAWSPDGLWVTFTRTCDRTRNDRLVYTDVWIASTTGDRVERRLTDTTGPHFSPSFSPDGASVAYYGHSDPAGSWSRNAHVLVQPVNGAPAVDVLAEWDYPCGSILMSDVHAIYAQPPAAWSPDGERLYFLATVGGTANLYSVSRAGGLPVAVTDGEQEVVTASFDKNTRRFAAVIATASELGDVYAGDVTTGELQRITHVNAALLADVQLSTPELITLQSGGFEIEGWVLKPPGFDSARSYPLLLQISPGPHFPHGHAFNFEYQFEAGAGYVVLYLNPRGISGYGSPFLKAREPLWIGNDSDDYLAAVDHVVAQGFVDKQRLGLTGDAYGGCMTNWIIGHDHRFAAAVSRRGINNFLSFFWTSDKAAAGSTMLLNAFGGVDPMSDPQRYLERSPLMYAPNVSTPVMIIHSEGDLRCELGEAEQMYIALRYLNKPARLVVYRNDTHFLSREGRPGDRADFFSTILEWFDSHLQSPAADDEPDCMHGKDQA